MLCMCDEFAKIVRLCGNKYIPFILILIAVGFLSQVTSAEMVFIPGGTFQMGDSFNEGLSGELPVHTVTLSSFYMGKYPVTNQQYCDFLNAAKSQGLITVTSNIVYQAGSGTSYLYCDTYQSIVTSQINWNGTEFSVRSKGGRSMANDPMVRVSWHGAVAYANWRSQQEGRQPCYNLSTWDCDFNKNGYSLPTEAQWEYAARGGLSGKRFPWGDTISQNRANFYPYASSLDSFPYDVSPVKNQYHPIWNDGVAPYTSPVGFFDGALKHKSTYNWPGSATSYQTTNGGNAYGLYDMAGNVWEWCNDWYGSYTLGPKTNPTGPTTGTLRVLRSGGWSSNAIHCRVTHRYGFSPTSRYYGDGFRLSLNSYSPYLAFSAISDQPAGNNFAVTISAMNENAQINSSFNGTVLLYVNGGPQLDKTHVTLKNGVWNGTLRLNSPAHSVSITAASGSISGTSNTFSVTSPTSENGRIEGTCVDGFNQPIKNVSLTVDLYQGSSKIRTTTTSTATGKFSFTNVPPGNYWLKSDGAKDLLITVDPGRTTAINMALSTIPLPGVDKRVVILVPGLMGSGNKRAAIIGSITTKIDDLKLYKPYYLDWVGWDALTEELQSKGYIVDTAPWDWRREINKTTVEWYLKSVIDHNIEKHNVEKVDIVSHSAGGLLTRYYIQSEDYDNDIDKFAMLGTPTGGASPDPYYIWYGADIWSIEDDGDATIETTLQNTLYPILKSKTNWYQTSLWSSITKTYFIPQVDIRDAIHAHIPGLRHFMLHSYQFKRQQGDSWQYADYPYASSLLTHHLATQTNKQRLIPGSNQSPDDDQVRTRLFLSKSKNTSSSIPVNAIDHSRELYPLGEPIGKPDKLNGDGTVVYDAAFTGLASGVHYDCVDNIGGTHSKLPGVYKIQVRDYLEEGRIPLGILSTQAISDEIRAMDLEEISEEMSIVFSSRVQPLVTAPNGQRLGILSDSGDVIEELTGNVLIYPQYASMNLTNPSEGEYLLQFLGYAGELLHIDATLYNHNDDDFIATKKTVLANTDINQLKIIVDKSQPSPIQIEGLVSSVNNLKAHPEGGLVQLTWDAPNDSRVVGYRVYALPESMQFFQLLNQTTETHLNTGHSWCEDDETAFWSYIVLSIDENGNESIVDYIVNNYDLLIARFTSDVVTGKAPLAVIFTDVSSGNPTAWQWDFNADGVVDSTEQNPVWTYNEPGAYTVTLKVESQAGSDSTIRPTYIDVKKDVGNLLGFIAVWLSQDCSDPAWCKGYDYNESGSVDLADFAIFAENWFGDTISVDINMSGHVNFLDFSILSSRWMNENCEQSAWCNGADLDRSGTVDILDLLIFAEHWLEGVSP